MSKPNQIDFKYIQDLIILISIHYLLLLSAPPTQTFIGGALVGRFFVDSDSKDLLLVMLLNGLICLFITNTMMKLLSGRRPLLVPIVSGFNSSSQQGNDLHLHHRVE